MTRGGLPHSDISGSKLICSSPELFAACHVLHRLLAPRHSPYTLSSLTIRNSRTYADWLWAFDFGLLAAPRVQSLEPEAFLRKLPCNTACPSSRLASLRRLNVVVGKNYRLQNIQLSKISWGPSPQAPGSLAGAQWPRFACLGISPLSDFSRNTEVAKLITSGPLIGAPPGGA